MISQILSSINYNNGVVRKHLQNKDSSNTTSRKSKTGSTGVSRHPITRRATSKSYVTDPTEYDVLCIKDKTWARHTGNRIYRERVLRLANEYDIASKQDKMKITRSIVQLMQQKYNARFLRQVNDDGVWEVITDKQARDKTSHALRFAAKTTSSSTTTKTTSSTMNDDNETIVSTSTLDHYHQHQQHHVQVQSESIDEEYDNENRFDDGHDEESETIASHEQEENVIPEEDDDELEQEEEQGEQLDEKLYDSFFRKCANIVEIDPKELMNVGSSEPKVCTSSFDDDDEQLYRRQQSRLYSLQRQYQYHNDKTGNSSSMAIAVPEEIQSSRLQHSNRRHRCSEATQAYLDMSLSLDDIFSYCPNDPFLLEDGVVGTNVTGGNVTHQEYDDLQLDFFDRY